MAAILSGIGLARQKMGEEAQKNYKKGNFFAILENSFLVRATITRMEIL